MKQQSLYITNPNLCKSGYTGFINVSGGKVFKSDIYQNEELELLNKPESIVIKSEFFSDWAENNPYKLPYTLNDVLLQPNEYALAHVVNKTFEKLYTNLEYILSRCYFYTNNIPTEYIGWFGCALILDGIDEYENAVYHVTNYQFNTPDKPCYQHMPCRFATISNIRGDDDLISGIFSTDYPHITAEYAVEETNVSTYFNLEDSYYDNIFKVINVIQSNGNRFCIMCTTSALLFREFTDNDGVLECKNYEAFPILSAAQNIKFADIASVDVSNKHKLYIVDNSTCNIYQYDLRYIINNDKVFYKPILLNIAGGNDYNDHSLYKFKHIDFIKCCDELLFVYDNNEYNFIVFDEYLNLNKQLGNIGFKNHKPVDITYRPLFKEYYILCEDGYVIVLDDKLDLKRTLQFNVTEKCSGIAASVCDSNIFYITTETQLLQKLFSNNNTIGNFELKKLRIVNDTDIWWNTTYTTWNNTNELWGGSYNFSYVDDFKINSINVQLHRTDNIPQDDIWIFANHGRIIMLKNNIKQISLLSNMNEIIYNKDDLHITEQSYVQASTYNILIQKLLQILISIANHVEYTPIFEYNSSQELVFNKLVCITEKININELINNLKIYDNDLLSTDIINRVLTCLYSVEEQLLSHITPQVNNLKYQIIQNQIINI